MPTIEHGVVITTAKMVILYNFTDSDQFIILNNGRSTHVSEPRYSSSCIDLTFASANIALSCEWSVEQDN